ncbi:MAG: DUF975 family protein [Nanoarchaeota archaeon]
MNRVFDRALLKENAKEKIKGKIFNLLVANIIVMLLTGSVNTLPGLEQVVSIALLVMNIGLSFFYLNFLDKGEMNYMDLFYSFNFKDLNIYFNHLGTILVKYLLVFLWTLLLIVPGIIKSIAYSQINYIRADKSDLEIMQCLRESEELMYGHKMEYFVLQLSFIGWYLLCGITLGLACIYVLPYHSTVMAMYYRYLCSINHETTEEDFKSNSEL